MRDVRVAATTEFAATTKKLVNVDGKAILLVRAGNAYYAIDNTCTHMGGSLYDGNLEGTQVTCPRHGSVFDVTTGKVVHPGTLLFMKVRVRDVRSYPVRVEGTDVMLGTE
jgi:3-phenylpropionate/trans-cinnamate dioxygenase ferredoxin subunit